MRLYAPFLYSNSVAENFHFIERFTPSWYILVYTSRVKNARLDARDIVPARKSVLIHRIIDMPADSCFGNVEHSFCGSEAHSLTALTLNWMTCSHCLRQSRIVSLLKKFIGFFATKPWFFWLVVNKLADCFCGNASCFGHNFYRFALQLNSFFWRFVRR